MPTDLGPIRATRKKKKKKNTPGLVLESIPLALNIEEGSQHSPTCFACRGMTYCFSFVAGCPVICVNLAERAGREKIISDAYLVTIK